MILAMKTISAFLLFLCCLAADLQGEQRVSFHELSHEVNENQIEICGFIYQADDGRTILASQPDLKSCCVGTSQKMRQQLVIEDLDRLPSTNQAVTLRGTFYLDPESGQQVLRQSVIIPKGSRLHLWLAGGTAGLIATFFLLRKRY